MTTHDPLACFRYTVEKGDSWYSIAKKFNRDLKWLLNINNAVNENEQVVKFLTVGDVVMLAELVER